MRGTLRLFLCELLHVLVRFMCCSNRDILKGSERRMKIDQSCSNKGKIIQKNERFHANESLPSTIQHYIFTEAGLVSKNNNRSLVSKFTSNIWDSSYRTSISTSWG